MRVRNQQGKLTYSMMAGIDTGHPNPTPGDVCPPRTLVRAGAAKLGLSSGLPGRPLAGPKVPRQPQAMVALETLPTTAMRRQNLVPPPNMKICLMS
jgi:hypothetical protein